MSAKRFAATVFALLAVLAACSKKSSSSEPPIEPNDPPTLQLPAQLSGSGGIYSLTLPVGDSVSLVFTATDPDNDPLQWQIVGELQAAAAVGLTTPTVGSGPSYPLQLVAVAVPATMRVLLIVEDSRGNAAAIDLTIVRNGPPTISAVTPNSAFAGAPQPVTITGSALSLAGTAATKARFDGLLGTFTTIPNETTLRCITPVGLMAGPAVVGVENVHGSAALAASEFTAYARPPNFQLGDSAVDGGAGSSAAMARDGNAVHVVWIEGGVVVHRASNDGGATWNTAQTISGGEVPTEPQVAVTGLAATVAWLGDGTTVRVRNSGDGGATFDAAQILNSLAGTQPARRLRTCAGGDHRYVAWLAGDPLLNAARVVVAASSDTGSSWTAPTVVDDANAQQATSAIACDGARAWIAFTDERQGGGIAGAYTSRTTDGGASWNTATRRSLLGATVNEPRLCADGDDVHVAWLDTGALRYAGSADGGAAWSPQVNMQETANGAITAPAIACESNRVFATYVAGGNSVWVTSITVPGSQPRHVQVSTAAVVAASPRVVHVGNYVFAAWRSDAVATTAARIQYAISVDVGQTFSTPAGFGDGTAAQDEPILAVDGASLLLCWLDYRGATPALFTNRNAP